MLPRSCKDGVVHQRFVPRPTVKSHLAANPFSRLLVNNAFKVEDAIKRSRMHQAREHGQVAAVEAYVGYGSTEWVRVLGRVQMVPMAVRRAGRRRFPSLRFGKRRNERSVRGWRSFVRVAVPHSKVTVRVDGVDHEVEADRGGIVDCKLPAQLAPGWQEVEFISEDGESTMARVFIIAPTQRYGLISDVDDTVMVTSLPRPLLAAWNTFVLDEHARAAVPGMNVLFQRIVEQFGGDSTPVLYLSTGSWNVAPTLSRFLGRNLYPFGPLLLTDWGPTTKRLFRSGTEHKRKSLQRLAEEFPHIQWLLVGDDGQHDEPIYGEFAANYPDSVRAVAIRQLSNTETVLAGGRASSSARWRSRLPVAWVNAPNGAGLTSALAELDIIAPDPHAADLVDLSKTLGDRRIARPKPPETGAE